MLKKISLPIVALILLPVLTSADDDQAIADLTGDAVAGQAAFKRQCTACHVVVDKNGETLAGKRARSGPNLYGVIGAQAGSVDGYRYSRSLKKAGEEIGLVWTEEALVAYLQNPTDYIRSVLDDDRARVKMSFRVRDGSDAKDIIAYLGNLSLQD